MTPFNKRNRFNLSHTHISTFEMGKLIPFYFQEVLPGDTLRVSTNAMIRLNALLAPIYHQINVYTHFFYVPNRLVFDDWNTFITLGKNGDSKDKNGNLAVRPTITSPDGGWSVGSLADYFGLPTGKAGITVDAYLFRMYALIYNEWYRNENLQDEVALSTAGGADTTTSTALLTRNWQSDYFTNCLPWTQRGEQVTVPLGTQSPVLFNNSTTDPYFNTQYLTRPGIFDSNGNLVTGATGSSKTVLGVTNLGNMSTVDISSNASLSAANFSAYADLSKATSATINDWRLAFQVQRLLEANARGGYRITEWILQHFGVRVNDLRVQRPEFLGGGKSPLIISEIVQTSASTDTSAQGNMAGHAFSAQKSHSFTKSFDEHGFVIGICSIMPRTAYCQGVNRQWTHPTSYDYYTPILSHLGEEGILNKEIYADGTSADEEVFGYNPRYQSYRTRYSYATGDMRGNMNYWNMYRIFENRPQLNSTFVSSDPTRRIFAVTDETRNCIVAFDTQVKAIRPIPKYGTPGFIDHA